MTEYRAVHDGYVERLQYKKKYKVLWFINREKWVYVPRPYYDRVYGRSLDLLLHDTIICSYNTNLDKFISQWPNINVYLDHFDKEQSKLVSEVQRYWDNINKKKGVRNI